MIITISGLPGCGKSTMAKGLAKKFKLKHYSTGDFMRKMAKKRRMSIIQLSHLAEMDRSIDKELDDWTEELGKKKDNFVIDSRLAWHFIPNSIKIFLAGDLDEAAKRIFEQNRHDEKFNETFEKTKHHLKERLDTEVKRFKRYYGINFLRHKNYDIIFETTKESKESSLRKIIQQIQEYL